VYDVVVKKITFVISSPDEFLVTVDAVFHYGGLYQYSLGSSVLYDMHVGMV